MRNDEGILDAIIKDGSVDIDEWPELLKRLLLRLDSIAHNSFPQAGTNPAGDVDIDIDIDIVSVAPSQSMPSLSAQPTQLTEPPSTQGSNAETSSPPNFSQDEASSTFPPRMLPPPVVVPAFPSPPPAPPIPKEPTPPPPPPGILHPEDLSLLTTLTSVLGTQFDAAPPYTVQRLAELLRHPTTHYRSLSKYLRAVQRVLSVSSPVTSFPLPPSAVDSMPNGATPFNLGSDESLGGALLSPIPWLTASSITEGGGGGGGGVNGVSQGELLRQGQELDIVQSSQVGGEEGVVVHAKGLPALGPEDVGPQPEGTVFPDPPSTLEEARSPRPSVEVEKEEAMGDAVVAEKGDGDGQQGGEGRKDDMDVDTKMEAEPTKEHAGEVQSKGKGESSEMMQLDGVSDTIAKPPGEGENEKKPEQEDAGAIS